MPDLDLDEQRMVTLFERASRTVDRIPHGVVRASIDDGVRRVRRRRLTHVVGVAAAAALVSSATTYVLATPDADPVPATAATPDPAPRGFGVAADQMAGALAASLGEGGEAVVRGHRNGAVPAWLPPVMGRLGFPGGVIEAPGSGARWASVSYQRGGTSAEVGVLVQKLTRDGAVAALLEDCEGGGPAISCTTTRAGTLVVRSADRVAVASLVTPDGWLVQSATDNDTGLPTGVLVQITMDEEWLQ